jgi:hypothetical protein
MARTVKEHLSEHHAKSASFDVGVASELGKLRKCFQDLETHTDGDGDLKNIYASAKECVAKLSDAFNVHGEYHRSMMADTQKSSDIDDLGKLAPVGVSAVYDPSKSPTGSRLVLRSGQRDPSTMPDVPAEFQHLVRVE